MRCGSERIAQFVSQDGEEFVFPTIGRAERLFESLPFREVASNLYKAKQGAIFAVHGGGHTAHIKASAVLALVPAFILRSPGFDSLCQFLLRPSSGLVL